MAVALNVVGDILLCPRFGIAGAAIATSVAQIGTLVYLRSQLKQLLMQQQMMLHSLQETSTPPTVGDFDRAMRLLRRTTHYKVAKGLRERAATDARRRAARRSKSKRLQLKGGWPIDPIAAADTLPSLSAEAAAKLASFASAWLQAYADLTASCDVSGVSAPMSFPNDTS